MLSDNVIAKPVAEYSTPMPTFVSQPSATLIYCKQVLSQFIRGLNGDAGMPALVKAEIYKNDNYIAIQFTGKQILVSSGMTDTNGARIYASAFPYKILNDDPENFFAMQDRTKPGGSLQTIALNRVAGTLIWTSIEASLPETDPPRMQGHPFVSDSFYVCSPKDD